MGQLIQIECESYLNSFCDANDGSNIDISIDVGNVTANFQIARMVRMKQTKQYTFAHLVEDFLNYILFIRYGTRVLKTMHLDVVKRGCTPGKKSWELVARLFGTEEEILLLRRNRLINVLLDIATINSCTVETDV